MAGVPILPRCETRLDLHAIDDALESFPSDFLLLLGVEIRSLQEHLPFLGLLVVLLLHVRDLFVEASLLDGVLESAVLEYVFDVNLLRFGEVGEGLNPPPLHHF